MIMESNGAKWITQKFTMIKYLSIIDKYLGKYNIFTSTELYDLDHLETEYRNSQPKYSFYKYLEIFPEAKTAIKQNLLTEITQYKKDLVNAEKVRITFNNEVLSKVTYEDRWFWSLVRDILFVNPLKDKREAKIKRNYFYLSALRTKHQSNNKITEQDILRAKEVPIETLYLGHLTPKGNLLVGFCPFHNDKNHPNFTIYTNTKSFYCFSCGSTGDSIEFIRKQQNLKFLDAVKLLIKK